MPTFGSYHPWELDARRWSNCLQTAERMMIAGGWNPHAGKFLTVKLRKAHQLWRGTLRAPV